MQQKWNQNFDGEPITDIPQKFLNAGCDVYMVMQLRSGELDMALLTPKDAQTFAEESGFTRYHMQTSDYRGNLFNFKNEYW